MKWLVFVILLTDSVCNVYDVLRSMVSAVFWNAVHILSTRFVLSSRDLEFGSLREKTGSLLL